MSSFHSGKGSVSRLGDGSKSAYYPTAFSQLPAKMWKGVAVNSGLRLSHESTMDVVEHVL